MDKTCFHCNEELDWRAVWEAGHYFCPACMASGQHARYREAQRTEFTDAEAAAIIAATDDADGEQHGALTVADALAARGWTAEHVTLLASLVHEGAIVYVIHPDLPDGYDIWWAEDALDWCEAHGAESIAFRPATVQEVLAANIEAVGTHINLWSKGFMHPERH